MNIRTILTLITLTALALTAALAFTLTLLSQAQKDLMTFEGQRYHSYQLADILRQSSDDLTRLARTYAVSGGEQKWLDQYQAILDIRAGRQPRPQDYHLIYWDLLAGEDQTPPREAVEARPLSDLMAEAGFTQKELNLLTEAQRNSAGLVEIENNAMTLVKLGQNEEAARLLNGPEYHDYKVRIMTPFLEFFRTMEARTNAGVETARAQTRTYISALFIMVIAMLSVIALGIWLVIRKMKTAIKHFADHTEHVARGDLTRQLDHEATREMGTIAQVFNQMVSSLKESISDVAGSNSTVAEVAHEVHQKGLQTSTAVDQQRRQTIQVASAINQLTASLNEITRSTEQASHAAENARSHVTTGQQLMEGQTDNIQRLFAEVERSAEAVGKLSRDCDEIGSILSVITGIAEQTNLLALNAAIEAARAGDNGRGFTVVADEVRNLARRTTDSTLHIQEMIERLQSGSQSAVRALENSRGHATECVSKGQLTTEAFTEIMQGADQILDMNNQIAAAVEEQSQVVEEVNRAVSEISTLAENVNSDMEHTVAACDSLNQLADQVRQRVSHFST